MKCFFIQLRITSFHYEDKPRRTTLPTRYQRNKMWYNPRFDPESTSSPMRHPRPMHRNGFEALTLRVRPISSVLFPGAGRCLMSPPPNVRPATPPSDERSNMMKKWVEGCSHIQHLIDCDKTPLKEYCLLVFQYLMIL